METLENLTQEQLIEAGNWYKKYIFDHMPDDHLDTLLKDTPYLQRVAIREQQRGREEAQQRMHRVDIIIETLQIRFGINDTEESAVADMLNRISTYETLQTLFRHALRAEQFADFWAVLVQQN